MSLYQWCWSTELSYLRLSNRKSAKPIKAVDLGMDLRPYQIEALQAIDDYEARGIRRQLLVLPTGTGKTIVFSHLNRFPLLVLAHREELLEQAAEKIRLANPEVSVEIEQGQRYSGRSDVVVASVPTLGRANSERLSVFERGYFRCVVIDEAHHAAAPTYRRVLDYFDGALRIGVTATPQRGDNVRLDDVFEEVVYFKEIKEMISDGWLAPLVGYRINSNCDIGGVATRAGDFATDDLAEAVNTEVRNKLAVRAYRELVDGKKCLVFCVDVAHARSMSDAFHADGISSAHVVGSTEPETRKKVLDDFRNGRIRVLTNCEVLTEGFDDPSVEAILMARPTQSQLLYTQIVGRGTRLSPGKEACVIIDIADTTRNKIPIGLPTLFGLPPGFDPDGDDILSTAGRFETLKEKSPSSASQVRNLLEIEQAFERIDLFTPPPPDPTLLEFSQLIWLGAGPERYVLGISASESLVLAGDALGIYQVVLNRRGDSDESLAASGDLKEAFSLADNWVRNNRADRLVLLDSAVPWRSDAPTEKQVKWLKKFGVPHEHLSKGEASQILDKLFAEKPKPKRPAWLEKKIREQKRAKGF